MGIDLTPEGPLFVISSIAFIVVVVLLAFFSAVKSNIGIARFLYLAFGILVIPITIVLFANNDEMSPWLMIWPGLFSFAGIGMFFGLSATYKEIKGTQAEEDFNKKFQGVAIKGGARRAGKIIGKNIKK